jgi:hypothetical protein
MDLVDFEWRFGVTASTSEVNQVGRSFVHLKLTLQEKETLKCTTKTIECSIQQFYKLFSELEQAQSQLEDMSLV